VCCKLIIWAKSKTLLKLKILRGVTVKNVVFCNLISCSFVDGGRNLLPPFCRRKEESTATILL
jgi:hypothetical protein